MDGYEGLGSGLNREDVLVTGGEAVALREVSMVGGVLGLEDPSDLPLRQSIRRQVEIGCAHKESSFNISAWEYAAPMTMPEVPDLEDTDLDAAGRLRQNGEADLLKWSVRWLKMGLMNSRRILRA